jgi:hypothetical protein
MGYEELLWKPKSVILKEETELFDAVTWGTDYYTGTYLHGCRAILAKIKNGNSVEDYDWFANKIITEYEKSVNN